MRNNKQRIKHMKRLILLAIIGIYCFTSCRQHDNGHGEVKKIIETRFYEPIKHGDEWICGLEISDIHHIRTIAYYDSCGNEIITKNINNKGDVSSVTKRYYYVPEEHKLSKIEREYPLTDEESETAYWIRDDKGRLIEIQGYVSLTGMRTMSCEYDEQGRRIKESWGDFVKHIKYNPENSSMDISVSQYEIYDSKCDYAYHSKPGIVESGVCIIDTSTGLLKREIIEFYKYGCLDTKYDIEYTYNADGKLVSESGIGAITAKFYEVPLELSVKEQEEYIVRNYYNGTEASIKRNYMNSWEYNKYGDCVKEIEIVNGSVTEEVNRIYEYNEHGDWVKCLVFHQSSFLRFLERENEEETPSEIVLRDITYL